MSQQVVVGGPIDDSQDYPQLSKLCVDAYREGSNNLGLGHVMVSPAEMLEVSLKCGVGLSNPQGPITSLDIVLNRILVKGGQTFTVEERTRDVQINVQQVKGVPEVIIAIHSDNVSTAIRYLLNLNRQGQPINKRDEYHGTVDPSKLASAGESPSLYNSGLYSLQSEYDSAITCVITRDCQTPVGQREISALVNSDRMGTSLTISLGWYATKGPHNGDLDRNDGRVDFQKSLLELKKLIEDRYRTGEETELLVEEVKTKLRTAN